MNKPRHFTGEFEHSIDAVNRVVIPAKWRTGESEEFFLASQRGRVAVLPQSEIEKLLQKNDTSAGLSEAEKSERAQMIFGSFVQVTCDKQGRVTIPEKVLSQSGLEGGVVLAGMGYRFNIWDPTALVRWKSEQESKGGAGLRELGIF